MSGETARTADGAVVTERDRPATFRDLFAVSEFRTLYLSLVVNYVGDNLAKAAVTVLVYQETKSTLLSAAAFAVSFLPWILGGTVLSALAERYPYRRVLLIGDLSRMVLVALLLIPGLPVPAMLLLVFLVSLGTPPTQAARSALIPLVVGRERLAIAIATNQTTNQASQVFGYVAGAALAAALNPRIALAIDMVTFAVSAALIARGVRRRPPAHTPSRRSHLLTESTTGFRMVFGNEALRAPVVMALIMMAFAVVPEGLAAAWAAEGNPGSTTRGLDQGIIMAACPLGWAVGGILVHRLMTQAGRDRLIRPLAILPALALVPAILNPPASVVALLALISGLAQGALSPTLNAKFALTLPHGFRARAFGAVQTSMQLSQFLSVVLTGWFADRFWLPLVVGLWSIGGTVVLAWLALRWPGKEVFRTAIEAAAVSNATAESVPIEKKPSVATATPELP